VGAWQARVHAQAPKEASASAVTPATPAAAEPASAAIPLPPATGTAGAIPAAPDGTVTASLVDDGAPVEKAPVVSAATVTLSAPRMVAAIAASPTRPAVEQASIVLHSGDAAARPASDSTVLARTASHHEPERTPLTDARTYAKDNPDDPQALKVWATAALRAGALREARRAGDVWALHDDSAEPRLFLANVLDAGGHRADAKAMLEEWIELHPDSQEARRLHARLSAELPAPENASHKSVAKR
jgi:hypothetical protein